MTHRDPISLPERELADPVDAERVLANVSAGLFGTPSKPTKIGRFTLLDRVGAGAMGTVYAAYDPELDRRVAIKVLHGALDDAPDRVQSQLLREARALAKLDHANVATVYEVGTVDGRLFMAMEFVDGDPLERWITGAHGWREVVRVFADAAAGLAAAHAAGLVHRDFKPGNVVLRRDGRVVVLDFGLARVADAMSASQNSAASPDALESVTQTGAIVGTPAYMAPEQHQGQPATERSDQFAFCVSLFEALYGQRPFGGTTRSAVLDAIERGDVEVPSGRDVPRRCLAAITRGLKSDQSERWPSMSALAAALTDDPGARWRRRALVPVVVAAAVAVTWSLRNSPAASFDDPCASASAAVDSLWNDDARGDIEAAITASGLPSAPFVLPRVVAGLDAYADAYRAEARALCRDEQAADAVAGLADRERCLQSRLVDLQAAVGVLRAPSDLMVTNVLYALPAAADVSACRRAVVRPTLAAADANRRIDLSSARARLLARGQVADESLEAAEDAAERARAAGDLHSLSRALSAKGRSLSSLGKFAEAEPVLFEAFVLAERVDDLEGKFEALDPLGRVLLETSKLEQADRITQLAIAVHERLGIRAPTWTVSLETLLGDLAAAREDFDASFEHFERARQAAEHPEALAVDRIAAAISMARPYLGRRQYREAIPLLRYAADLTEDLLGPTHDARASALNNLAIAYYFTANMAAAESAFREAIAIRRQLEGEDAPGAAAALMGLGGVVMNHDPEEAVRIYEEALAAHTRGRGPESRNAAATRLNLAIALRRLGRNDEARTALEHGVRTLEAADVSPSARLRGLMHLVEIDVDQADCAAAAPRIAKANTLADPANPGRRASTIRLRVAEARCQPAPSARIRGLEDALAACKEHGVDGYPRAKAAVALAEALQDADVARVHELLLMAHRDLPLRTGVDPRFIAHLDALSETVALPTTPAPSLRREPPPQADNPTTSPM